MRIALAQLNYHTGHFDYNTNKIITAIQKAKAEKADLVIFAELAICGYPPRDFLEFDHFLELCEQSMESIARECVGIAAIVGGPSHNPRPEGKNLFNSAFYLKDGKIEHIYHKTLLPTYDVFDEYRYFEPAIEHSCIELNGCRIALTICEDIWDLLEDPLYTVNPMDQLISQAPDFMVNIAASPFAWKHDERRKDELRKNASKYQLPIFYVNHVGAQTELIFDGASTVMNARGSVYDVLDCFTEDLRIYDLEDVRKQSPIVRYSKPSKYELIHDGLVLGIRDYFQKLGFKKAILGLSGGIDSALVAVLATEALGNENVQAVMMPTEYTSGRSKSDAEKLADILDISYKIIPVQSPYQAFLAELNPYFGDMPFGIAEENMQARSRAIILMALANKFGYILLNTSNKSELAVGYGTLYGDMAGGLSVIGDIYKTEVFELCRYINRNDEKIPESILTRPPTAELRPDQKDSDSLPPYQVLDEILHEYIEMRLGPREIVANGYDEATVKRILKMVNQSEYKRAQFPPILRVSDKAFGMGRRMPIVAKYLG
ncbi:MAG: NAD+ synthase [Bacteroidia bacterium]